MLTPDMTLLDLAEKCINGNDIMCLAHLIGKGKLGKDATLQDAINWFLQHGEACDRCEVADDCAVMIINE